MILYHYCSNFVFHSIVSQKRVRLSLLSLSNDAKEGQHIVDVAARLLSENLTHKCEILQELRRVIGAMSAIGFCLSADGDLLSQWRGYADDAQGVAIGFDRGALSAAAEQETDDNLIVRLSPVVYDESVLVEFMGPHLQPVIDHYKSGKMATPRLGTLLTPMSEQEREEEKQRYSSAPKELFKMLMRIVNYTYMVKSPFFKEENEWRIVALLANYGLALELPNSQFQPSHKKLTPFREFPLNGFSPSTIKEIVLGPRNQTPVGVAQLFLNSEGFEHVLVSRSAGSYR